MFGSLKEKIKAKTEGLKLPDSGTDLWNKVYPKIEMTVVNGFLDIAEDRLTNDEDVKLVILKIYELLPTLIRLTVSRDFFMEKVFTHKEVILEKVLSIKNERKESTNEDLVKKDEDKTLLLDG